MTRVQFILIESLVFMAILPYMIQGSHFAIFVGGMFFGVILFVIMEWIREVL